MHCQFWGLSKVAFMTVAFSGVKSLEQKTLTWPFPINGHYLGLWNLRLLVAFLDGKKATFIKAAFMLKKL